MKYRSIVDQAMQVFLTILVLTYLRFIGVVARDQISLTNYGTNATMRK